MYLDTAMSLMPAGNFSLEMSAMYPSVVKFMFTDADNDQALISVYGTHVYVDSNPDFKTSSYGVNIPLSVMRFLLIVQESLMMVDA